MKRITWTLSGYNFPNSNTFEVTDHQAALWTSVNRESHLTADEQSGRQIRFNLSFLGSQNESVEMLHDGQRPHGPKLMLANADGTLCYTNTFEFG